VHIRLAFSTRIWPTSLKKLEFFQHWNGGFSLYPGSQAMYRKETLLAQSSQVDASGQPMDNWYSCKFLESTENLKPLVRALTGRAPSTAKAHEITSCLQQGRLFYEAAAASPLEIRPATLLWNAGLFQGIGCGT
jgi:hypothetical protein